MINYIQTGTQVKINTHKSIAIKKNKFMQKVIPSNEQCRINAGEDLKIMEMRQK